MGKCAAGKRVSSTSFYGLLVVLVGLLWIVASLNSRSLPSFPKRSTFREFKRTIASYNLYTPIKSKPSWEKPVTLESVQDILNALRSTTVRAGNKSFTSEERELWQNENPCRSRAELPRRYALRKFTHDVAPNPQWDEVFKEYTVMHRTCMQSVANLRDYFRSGNTSTGCKFLVVELPKVGLGNKLLMKASVMLFAVLTQRVLLLPDKLNITEHLCEPFTGSTWKLETSAVRNYGYWHSNNEFQLWVDKSEYREHTSPKPFYAANLNDPYQPLARFYCNTEQAYMSKVTWMSIGGCLYFLPKLFSIPVFRPALEDLFPDKMALTHILRTVFLPADPVWERIVNVNDVYLEHNHRLIGVQLRYFGKQAQYRKKNHLVNERVMQCAIENELLPKALPPGKYSSTYISAGNHHRRTSKVFIASLFPGLHDYLRKIYLRQMTETGEGVGLVQLTHEREQHFGPEIDIEALVEIMCLSLSDALFITPVSTFGGLAQAYGALKPWFINFDGSGPVCERAQTVDVCFDQAMDEFICPHDPAIHRQSVTQSVPYIKRCLRNDANGVQLITNHESNPPLSEFNKSTGYA